MKIKTPTVLAFLSLFLLIGCPSPEPENGGNGENGEQEPLPDAGDDTPDAGPAPDAGEPEDAGAPPYAGPPDAGQPYDVGPPPPPDHSTLTGYTRYFHYRDGATGKRDGVSVSITNYPAGANAADFSYPSSDADTALYSIPDLTPGSYYNISAKWAAEPAVGGNNVPPGFLTRQRAYIGAEANTDYNPYVVTLDWLVQTAYECGVYATRQEAEDAIGTDFVTYSTVIGTLKDAGGVGVAGVQKTDIQVQIGNTVNIGYDAPGNYTCFLEEYDDGGTYKIRGTTNTASNTTGRYAVFKVRGDNGTGGGTVYARALANGGSLVFGDQYITLNAGTVAVLNLETNVDAPPAPINFDEEIVPIFSANYCTACHRAGGQADNGANALLFYDVTPEAIYTSLLYPDTDCSDGTYERVCLDNPLMSKIITKPLQEDPPDHPNGSFDSLQHPDLIKLQTWVEQGAPRIVPPVEPPPLYADLPGVMQIASLPPEGAGCVACHAHDYAGGPKGGLPLDGCVNGLNNEYSTAGVDYDPDTNPYYKEDCVHYHLTAQNRGTPPYRVDTNNPAGSLLLTNPLTGDPEPHQVKVFANTDDPRYVYLKTYIEQGAQPYRPDGGTPAPVDGGAPAPGPDGGVDGGPDGG
jgi:hypothetical protein